MLFVTKCEFAILAHKFLCCYQHFFLSPSYLAKTDPFLLLVLLAAAWSYFKWRGRSFQCKIEFSLDPEEAGEHKFQFSMWGSVRKRRCHRCGEVEGFEEEEHWTSNVCPRCLSNPLFASVSNKTCLCVMCFACLCFSCWWEFKWHPMTNRHFIQYPGLFWHATVLCQNILLHIIGTPDCHLLSFWF